MMCSESSARPVVGATAASSNMNDEAILVVHYIVDHLSDGITNTEAADSQRTGRWFIEQKIDLLTAAYLYTKDYM